jgi:hypothetical protein
MAWPDPSRYARDRVVARARARSRSLSVCARFGCWHTITGAGGTIQLQHGARASASGTNETTSRVSRNHRHRWMHGAMGATRRRCSWIPDSEFRIGEHRAERTTPGFPAPLLFRSQLAFGWLLPFLCLCLVLVHAPALSTPAAAAPSLLRRHRANEQRRPDASCECIHPPGHHGSGVQKGALFLGVPPV